MRLYYYKESNFGDALNPLIWEKLLPMPLDKDMDIGFLGIGTLLNEIFITKMQACRWKVIFGTGVGYGKKVPPLDDSHRIYCVRGALSARKLGLPESLGITDGALFVKDLFPISQPKKYRFSYMPHYELAGEGWAAVCRDIGFGYIDPRWSVEKVLSLTAQTEILLTEAMHGAIVADAFRVPWIPIVTNPTILPFKWHDWCSSVGMDYKPVAIERLQHPNTKKDLLSPLRDIRAWTRQKSAAQQLLQVAKTTHPHLSTDRKIEECSARLYEKLELFKKDWNSGLFL